MTDSDSVDQGSSPCGAANFYDTISFMNYQKIHDAIIENAKAREIDIELRLLDYKEIHHIIPRCMGGSDDRSNLVELTAREHGLIHWVLTKIYPTHKGILTAAWLMLGRNKSKFKLTPRMYENLRKKVIQESTHKAKTMVDGYTAAQPVSCRFPLTLLKKLDALSKDSGRTVSDIIRISVEKYIESEVDDAKQMEFSFTF